MIIKSNKKVAYEKFMFLDEGQLFSIDNLCNNKRYFIKIKSSTIPSELKPNNAADYFGCGYAVDLASGEFTFIKLDTNIILENGSLMLED